ncbi:MAG: P-loop NTPase fold protein [Candidatus Omnitrophota bacterium]
MVNPLKRLKRVEQLIEHELYFTIHAPRKTGKTTYICALARRINAEGKYIAMVLSLGQAEFNGISVEKANESIINALYLSSDRQLKETFRPPNPELKHYPDLANYLTDWCESQEKPIVLFIDGIDSLLDDVLVSVLRQLRSGYPSRPKYFPSSIIMVGLRDTGKYKIGLRNGDYSYSGDIYNITSDSLLLPNFKKEEVAELLELYTQDTGQIFLDEVKEETFRLSNGQPWLVNALARQMTILENDYSKPITMNVLIQAKNKLIQRRATHLDNLFEVLKEERVKEVVQAIINGDNLVFDIMDDDILYVRGLGIVSETAPLTFANPVYAEMIPRILLSPIQASIPLEIQTTSFVKEDGQLDMEKILSVFQEFYMENAEPWLNRFIYKQCANYLLLIAFLQRVINSGGEIMHEMAGGNGRIDLLVKFKEQYYALEFKIKRDKYTIEDGKEQLDQYLDHLGLKKGYLVIFDPADIEWEKKIYLDEITYNDKAIILVGV